MAETAPEPGPELSRGERLKRAAIGVLFFLILLIPRARRLRRRVGLWTLLRVIAAHAGLAVIWGYRNDHGWGTIAAAAMLLGFALFVGATPVTKSLDERARELGALAVLNAGTLAPSRGAAPQKVNLFAGTERLTVDNVAGQTVLEIPLPKIQSCRARAIETGEGRPWVLEIVWGPNEPQTTCFHFAGFFAEHLARVAETTIQNLRRKELPVVP